MRFGLALLFATCLAQPALSEVLARVSNQVFVAAINRADQSLVPYRDRKVSPRNVELRRCSAPDEEPTEFRCSWRLRTSRGWVAHRTWLVMDGDGWRVMDNDSF